MLHTKQLHAADFVIVGLGRGMRSTSSLVSGSQCNSNSAWAYAFSILYIYA